LADANGDKNNDAVQVHLNELKPAANPIQSQHQNNHHQQQLENVDNYSTPTSPAKSEVRHRLHYQLIRIPYSLFYYSI